MDKKIILPTSPRKAVAINPGVLMLYAAPKVGKTTITAQLPNSLMVQMEPRGADFVDANVIEAKSPNDFEAICNQIIADGCPYDYVIFDTVTKLDEWSEMVSTFEYMQKNQGRRFNRDEKQVKLSPKDPRFETVHSLPNGNGYQFSRQKMNEWYNLMSKTGKHVIILAHLKDKLVESKSGDTVEAADINLTGKVKSNYCIRVDAVGHLYKDGDKGFINFNTEFSTICGGRSKHLKGDILISEKQEDDSIVTYWDNIYLQE